MRFQRRVTTFIKRSTFKIKLSPSFMTELVRGITHLMCKKIEVSQSKKGEFLILLFYIQPVLNRLF